MTNYNLNIIITIRNSKKVNDFQWEVKGGIAERDFLQCMNKLIFEKNMDERNVQSKAAAVFLIYLFKNCGKSFSCTKAKLGKMLAITAFAFAKKGEKIFVENVRRYGNCGAVVDGLKLLETEYYFQDIPSGGSYNDNEAYIENIPQEIENNARTSESFDIPEDLRCVLLDVFKIFGAYSPSLLGQCLNDIISIDGMVYNGDLIDISRVGQIANTNITNAVTRYLF